MEKKKEDLTGKLRQQLGTIDPIFHPLKVSFKPSLLTQDNEGKVKVVELVINGQIKRCEVHQHVVDISGGSSTDNNGVMTWNLLETIDPCRPDFSSDKLLFCDPFNFVATPASDKPVFVTVRRNGLLSFGPSCFEDISFEVYTWDAEGRPAPKVGFYWRCRGVFQKIEP